MEKMKKVVVSIKMNLFANLAICIHIIGWYSPFDSLHPDFYTLENIINIET